MSAVVLLHGWGLGASVFDGLSRQLAAGSEASALDLPGYGAFATRAAGGLEEIAERIAASAPRRCCVVGWSLGALAALAWARSRPEQVQRLALVAATPCFVQREDWSAAMERPVFDAFAQTLGHDRAGTLERFVSLQAQGDSDARATMHALRAALRTGAAPGIEVLEQGLRILCETDLRPHLRAVEQPALVVHGDRDRLVPRAAAEHLARALPHARLAVIPGAAHAPFVSQPERVGGLIREFFDER
jgi:pimeloyl-[acyl-carrier protein] methyl ester esterase